MKGLYLAVVVACFLIIPVSWFYGQKMDALRADLWRPERESLSRIEKDAEFAAFENDRWTLHLIVKAFTLPIFLLAMAVFTFDLIKTRMGWGWRIPVAFGALIAIFMTLWSLMLSGMISFDEVYPAWIIAALVLSAICIMRQCMPKPATPQA